MADDPEIAADFLRSLFWKQARDSGSWLKKRGLKNAIRDYLTHVYAWMGKPEEHTEREKYVGRVEFIIRSNWARKGARTRAKNKALRKKRKIEAAERAHTKWRKEREPELFDGLPVQNSPKKSRRR